MAKVDAAKTSGRSMFFNAVDGGQLTFRCRLAIVLSVVALIQIVAWSLAIAAFWTNATAFGFVIVAFFLGLRHGFDADHIAAVDNFARQLVNRGEKPAAVGFFFSSGHCAVVIVISALIAVAAFNIGDQFGEVRDLTAFWSTLFSISILLGIALMNIVVARRLFNSLDWPVCEETSSIEAPRGVLAFALKPLLRCSLKSWQLFFVGVIFGLGFETATAIALLSITAAEAAQGLHPATAMIFPLIFTAGMTLIDTLQGVFMVSTYGWALSKPRRKLQYNFVITSLSAAVALVVGIVELITFLPRTTIPSWLWDWAEYASNHFEEIGAATVACFAIIAIWFAVAKVGGAPRPDAARSS